MLSEYLRGGEGPSRPRRPEGGRLDHFFEKIKEHITEALSGMCVKLDMVESDVKARDTALFQGLSQLPEHVIENEANRVAGAEWQKNREDATVEHLEQFRVKNRHYHEGLMQYFGCIQGN